MTKISIPCTHVPFLFANGPGDAKAAFDALEGRNQSRWFENGVEFRREDFPFGDVKITACVAPPLDNGMWDYGRCRPMFRFNKTTHLWGEPTYKVRKFDPEIFLLYEGRVNPWVDMSIQSPMYNGAVEYLNTGGLTESQFEAYAQIFGAPIQQVPSCS